MLAQITHQPLAQECLLVVSEEEQTAASKPLKLRQEAQSGSELLLGAFCSWFLFVLRRLADV